MRQVSRFAHRTRHVLRRPPPPDWLAAARRVAVVVGMAAALVSGKLFILDNEGARHRIAEATTLGLDASARAGLVVRDVYAEGHVYTAPDELLQALRLFVGKSMLTLDIDAVRERLLALPWVKSVSIRRDFPDRLIATITEHRPLALWNDNDRLRLVDVEGEVVPTDDLHAFADFPLLTGEHAPKHAQALFAMLSREPSLARRVTGAARIGQRRWNVYLDGRIEIRLPSEDADAAWSRLAQHERRDSILERAIESVDLRIPDRLTVRVKTLDPDHLPQGA